ncbi:MAG: radical SAM protein [Candidatus Aenigmarchaeota archaeon]|nr:radical SAM protein [Candidatus Aenigmarchaeota archaeon]
MFDYKCNNNCLHCAVDSEKNCGKIITNQNIDKFIDSLKNEGDFELEISGGEPTCKKEFLYYIERIVQKYPNTRYIVLSNGRNFSNKWLAEKLAELNPLSVLIPIHADTAELHDRISQSPGSFEETLQGIENLYDCDVQVGLKTVINKINYKRMPHLIEMVIRRFPNCPGITINGLDVQGKALKNDKIICINIRETIPYIEAAIDVAKKNGLYITLYSIPPCMVKEKYRKYIGRKHKSNIFTKTPTTDMLKVTLMYGTVDKCKGCVYYKTCTGTWYSYFDYYGTDELKPIRQNND